MRLDDDRPWWDVDRRESDTLGPFGVQFEELTGWDCVGWPPVTVSGPEVRRVLVTNRADRGVFDRDQVRNLVALDRPFDRLDHPGTRLEYRDGTLVVGHPDGDDGRVKRHLERTTAADGETIQYSAEAYAHEQVRRTYVERFHEGSLGFDSRVPDGIDAVIGRPMESSDRELGRGLSNRRFTTVRVPG
jgi:hypothetical protein